MAGRPLSKVDRCSPPNTLDILQCDEHVVSSFGRVGSLREHTYVRFETRLAPVVQRISPSSTPCRPRLHALLLQPTQVLIFVSP